MSTTKIIKILLTLSILLNTSSAACIVGADCPPPYQCEGGICCINKGCGTPSDCPPGYLCANSGYCRIMPTRPPVL